MYFPKGDWGEASPRSGLFLRGEEPISPSIAFLDTCNICAGHLIKGLGLNADRDVRRARHLQNGVTSQGEVWHRFFALCSNPITHYLDHPMMRTLIFVLSILVLPLPVQGSEDYGSVRVDEITSIYDADTFRATIHSWPAVVGFRIPVRVRGVDAPELRGKCPQETELAREAKQFSAGMLRKGSKIILENIERGKYFRLIADIVVDGESLGEALIDSGHARFYHGGQREGWCDLRSKLDF